MNAPIPDDDLLSAFHDREVTPDEESAAQSRLGRWLEAKKAYADYQQISEFLRALPREAAPPEFASSVMQRAERETLIPLDAPGLREVAASTPRMRKRPPRLALSVAAGAIAAAALFAVISLARPVRNNQPAGGDAPADAFGLAGGERGTTAESVAGGAMAGVQLAENGDKAVPQTPATGFSLDLAKWGSPASAKAKAPALASSAQPSSTLASTDGAYRPSASPSPPQVAADAKSPQPAGFGEPQLAFPADLKTAKVGDVVEALEEIGNQVAVVRLTVVSHAEGLDGIESLLVRNAGRAVHNSAEIEALRSRIRNVKQSGAGAVSINREKTADGGGDLICVFVEGTRDELLGVLQDVQNESHIQGARLTNTISPTQLQRYSNGAFASAAEKSNPRPQRPQLVASLPVSTVDKIVSERELARRWDIRPPAKKAAADKPDVSFYELQGRSAVARGAAQPGQNSLARRSVQKDRAAKRDAGKSVASAPRRSYQVFFVLDDANGTSSPPASHRAAIVAQRPRREPVSSAAQSPPATAVGQPAAPAASAPAPSRPAPAAPAPAR